MIITIVLTAGAVAFLAMQRDENRRRLVASTLDHWRVGYDQRAALRNELAGLTITEALTTHGQQLNDYFNELEYLAVAANHGAIDAAVLDTLDGSQILKAWAWAEPWIGQRQRQTPSSWAEIEALANKLIAIRTAANRPVPGNTRYLKDPVMFPVITDETPTVRPSD